MLELLSCGSSADTFFCALWVVDPYSTLFPFMVNYEQLKPHCLKYMTLYTLENSNGIRLVISPFGGVIKELWMPDRQGDRADIVLGFETMEEYRENDPYFGAIVGRYGNRIRRGQFVLDGEVYQLATNNGVNHLHGGDVGFNDVLWRIEEVETADGKGLKLSYVSADGEEGYPGELDVEVIYSLSDTDDLSIEYRAKTTKPTHVNLTQHSYFNLGGHDNGTILDHDIWLNADFFTPTDEGWIPTGEIRTVEGTPFDLRKPQRIEDRINLDDEQLKIAGGFDHNFVLNKLPYDLSRAATVSDAKSGRMMEVYTTEPGIQFYCGNYLTDMAGKAGARYQWRSGLCLETQHFPDSPNKSMFPSTRLNPGEEYLSTTVYKFGIE